MQTKATQEVRVVNCPFLTNPTKAQCLYCLDKMCQSPDDLFNTCPPLEKKTIPPCHFCGRRDKVILLTYALEPEGANIKEGDHYYCLTCDRSFY